MEQGFWHQRWAENAIGFHLEEVNPFLVKCWSELHISADSKVFVPMCGKSRDMTWLREQGHSVLGVEISDTACKAFFEESGVEPDIDNDGRYLSRSLDGIALLCGDFFALESSDLEGVRAVYDRASLIALPEEMRQRYVERMLDILPVGVNVLIITLEFDAPSGPPFSVTEAEIRALYGSRFEVVKLCETDLMPIKAAMGRETVWRLTEKD